MKAKKLDDATLARLLRVAALWLERWGAGYDLSRDRSTSAAHAQNCRQAATRLRKGKR